MGFSTVFYQVLLMFLLMSLGYLATKIQILSRRTAQDMTAILVTFVSPVLILNAFSAPYEPAKARNLLLMVALYLLISTLHILLSRLLRVEKGGALDDRLRQKRFSFVYSNTGFMGIPLVMALFGSEGVFYGAIALAAQSIFIWTHGFRLLAADEDGNPLLKTLSNPNILALILGVVIYFSPWRPGEILSSLFGYISNLNTPMSMLVIGNSIANLYLLSVFTDRAVWKATFLRNIVSPMMVIGILLLLPVGLLDDLPALVIVVMWSCPVAANAVMFSKLGNRNESFAARLVAHSTMLSALSLPLMTMLAQYFLLP